MKRIKKKKEEQEEREHREERWQDTKKKGKSREMFRVAGPLQLLQHIFTLEKKTKSGKIKKI